MAVSAVSRSRGAGSTSTAPKAQETIYHGSDVVTVTQVTLDATAYVAGGLPLTAAQLGLNAVLHATASVKTVTANGPVSCWYDTANAKLKCNAAAAEVGAVSLSGAVIEVVAYGF